MKSTEYTRRSCAWAIAISIGSGVGCSVSGPTSNEEAQSATVTQAASVTGAKKVLFIRAQFKPSGDPEDGMPASLSDTSVDQLMTDLDTFYDDNSFGALRFATIGAGSDKTPVFTLPKTKADYDKNFTIYADGLALAKQAGFDPDDKNLYDFVVLAYGNNTCGAQTDPNGRNIWIRGCGDTYVFFHEFRHGILNQAGDPGWGEADYWQPSAATPYDPIDPAGHPLDYGDLLNIGGNQMPHPFARHLSAREKYVTGWITDAEIATAPTGQDNIQTVRLYAIDDSAPITSGYRAFSIPRNLFGRTDLEQTYWGEYRSLRPDVTSVNNGVVLHWAPFSKCGDTTVLDMRPDHVDARGSLDEEDVGLFIGKTFSDASAKIAITPTTLNATSPNSIDVVIATGEFASNHYPTGHITSPAGAIPVTQVGKALELNANGQDADGDPLAYYWEFGDNVDATQNAPIVTHTWAARGTYTVSVQISDHKVYGTLASQQVEVLAAAPGAPPANFAATPVTSTQINLNWSTVSDAATYQLERSAPGGSFVQIASLVPSLSSYPDLSLSPNTTYQYRIRACSVDNTCSAYSNIVSATTPARSPTVNITAPTDNASFTAPASITIRASASESGGRITKVEFYQGGTLLGTDTTAPYSVAWSNVGVGSYSLVAKAYDGANFAVTSSPVHVTVQAATSPCDGLCSNPVNFTINGSFQSGAIGTGAVCYQTMSVVNGGNCGNFVSPRTLSVNGTVETCNNLNWTTLPPKRNGGYCFQTTSGNYSWAYFVAW